MIPAGAAMSQALEFMPKCAGRLRETHSETTAARPVARYNRDHSLKPSRRMHGRAHDPFAHGPVGRAFMRV
jgi:hypothetical protein